MDRVVEIGAEPDPAKRLRKAWAKSLEEHLDLTEMTRKEFQRALAEHGCDVSLQAISFWLRGDWSPKPHHQAAIAAVFRVPVRSLFPIGTAA